MRIKPIRNDDDLRASFRRLERLFQAPEGSPEADEREVLVALVEAYENRHYPIGPADPIEAIKFRMEQLTDDLPESPRRDGRDLAARGGHLECARWA